MKKLLAVCLLACLSSGVAAEPQTAIKFCEDMEQAATTGRLKGLPPEKLTELMCDVVINGTLVLARTSNRTDLCQGAMMALRKAYIADYAPPGHDPQAGTVSCGGLPCSCRVTFGPQWLKPRN
jgi:hypothetical protein